MFVSPWVSENLSNTDTWDGLLEQVPLITSANTVCLKGKEVFPETSIECFLFSLVYFCFEDISHAFTAVEVSDHNSPDPLILLCCIKAP